MTTTSLVRNPSLDGPDFLFGDGGVSNGVATTFPASGVADGDSSWVLTQWHMSDYINPAVYGPMSDATADPVYGLPKYFWVNASDTASLSAYQASDGTWVYGLQSTNGWDGAIDGGANLALSDQLSTPITMNNTVDYSADIKITNASVSGNGAAFLNSGFTLSFHDPNGGAPDIGLFLQIPITHSEGETDSNYYSQTLSPGGTSITAIAQGLLAGSSDPYFDFAPSGQTVHVNYSSLNLYLQQAISTLGFAAATENLADWTLSSIYVGTEVTNTDGQLSSGFGQIGLQISNIQLSEVDGPSTENHGQAISASATAETTAIVNLYQQVLGREPDSGALQNALSALNNGASISQIQLALANSPEALSNVSNAYMDILGRPIDSVAATNAVALLHNGGSLAQIKTSLANSQEAQNAVTSIYMDVLNRTPDAAGLAYFQQSLGNGGSLAEVRVAVATSPEGMADVSNLYEADLGRSPDAGGLSFYSQHLSTDMSLPAISTSLINSTEVAGDISSFYQSTLGHQADPTDLAAGRSELASGITMSTLQSELGELSGGAPPASNGAAVSITPQTTGTSPISYIYGLLNNDSLIASQPDAVSLLSEPPAGIAIITGFNVLTDVIQLQTTQAANFASVKLASPSPTDTLVTIGGGAEIYLSGVPENSIHAANFRFV